MHFAEDQLWTDGFPSPSNASRRHFSEFCSDFPVSSFFLLLKDPFLSFHEKFEVFVYVIGISVLHFYFCNLVLANVFL